jgi:hypothetical membrane protein
VYEALLKSKADASSAFLDDLLAKRDNGELADHVAKLAKGRCKRSNFILMANLAGTGVALILGLLVARWYGCRDRLHTGIRVLGENYSARIATVLQRVVFVCVAYFVVVLIVLHILEPGFDPRFRFMSEYALSHHGWLMTTAFFALGFAPFVAAIGLRREYQSSRSTRIGLGLLVVAAIFLWLAGIFKDSIPHLLASVVAIPSTVMAVLVLSCTFRRALGWQTIYLVTLFIALGMFALFISMVADAGMPGLQQRVFIFLFLLWLSVVVQRLGRVKSVVTQKAAPIRPT